MLCNQIIQPFTSCNTIMTADFTISLPAKSRPIQLNRLPLSGEKIKSQHPNSRKSKRIVSRNSFLGFLTTVFCRFFVPCRTQNHNFPSLTLPPSSFFIQIGCISSKLLSKPKSRKHSVDIICSFARIIVSTSRVVHLHREGADEYYCCWEAIMSTLGDNANL